MKKTFKYFLIIAVITAFAFSGCEGPEGLPGGPSGQWPDPEGQTTVNILMDSIQVSLARGNNTTLTATAQPSYSTVSRLTWRLEDETSAEIIRLSRPGSGSASSSLSGGSVVVTALTGGEARIRVTALGGGNTELATIITITVPSITNHLNALRTLETLPPTFSIPMEAAEDLILPEFLYFDGETVEITITGTGETLLLQGTGALFRIGNGVTLRLQGVTLQGLNPNPGGAFVIVENGGTLIMEAGSKITGNINTAPGTGVNLVNQGGAVRINSGGTFTMNDGEISDNSTIVEGGGVFNLGTFNMNGGTISDNATTSGVVITSGGAGVSNRGTFNLNGGLILFNTVNAARGAGGGVLNALTASVFVMVDGSIIGNEAGSGGGVINFGEFTMHDGLISQNDALNTVGADLPGGGGVSNFRNFTMLGGTISDNTAAIEGGGVINYFVFTMEDGEISGNTTFYGGGVANRNTFNMHGGTISGNTAEYAQGLRGGGGGVCNLGSTFYMFGGTISGNKAGHAGGGVDNDAGTFRMINGIIHGTNETATALRNESEVGSALFAGAAGATAERGTYSGGVFTQIANILTSNTTINVVNGVRQ
ncbi:MAG: hypothetical protein FWC97_00555 [Treponema sp.]|nr:hypothetical protein [Treponema sp.]